MFYQDYILTPIGVMKAIYTEHSLTKLSFAEDGEEYETIETDLIITLRKEIDDYFSGKISEFSTPISLNGTVFQNQVWTNLLSIKYGNRSSYKEQAISIGSANKARAVALANAANPILIIVPCHRVIRSDGCLSGYSAGKNIKEYLLAHEAENIGK